MVQLKAALLTIGAVLASSVYAVTPLLVQGADFVNSINGQRFQVLGVAYQPGGSAGFNPGSGVDPLSNATVCMRDAILMQRLGVNAIRVYNLDPDLDHSDCASIFNAAGIYMILDVNSPLPGQSLNRGAPWEDYDLDYITRVFQIVEAFKNFNNTLGFFSANEIINEDAVPLDPAYTRAVTNDIKEYIKNHAPRAIPVGYSAADVRPLLADTYTYLACNLANATTSNIDFFGLNSYSWCGDATYTSSTYDVLVEDFSNTTVPVFFSEYGCNQVKPRTFTEVGTIYSSPMFNTFSGGVVYQYSEEENDFGLVVINSNSSISIRVDYDNFMSQIDKIDLKALTAANGTATSLTAPTCNPSLLSSKWNLTRSFELPARPDGFDALIQNGVSGSFPSGTHTITDTAEVDTVYGSNGQQITGLKLTILANDQSNLPGNNTTGDVPSTTKDGSGSSPTHNAASQMGSVNLALIAAGAFALGVAQI